MAEDEDFEIIEKQPTTKEDSISEDSSFLMKKGDYTIHVLIEEVKNIITKKNNMFKSM